MHKLQVEQLETQETLLRAIPMRDEINAPTSRDPELGDLATSLKDARALLRNDSASPEELDAMCQALVTTKVALSANDVEGKMKQLVLEVKRKKIQELEKQVEFTEEPKNHYNEQLDIFEQKDTTKDIKNTNIVKRLNRYFAEIMKISQECLKANTETIDDTSGSITQLKGLSDKIQQLES